MKDFKTRKHLVSYILNKVKLNSLLHIIYISKLLKIVQNSMPLRY